MQRNNTTVHGTQWPQTGHPHSLDAAQIPKQAAHGGHQEIRSKHRPFAWWGLSLWFGWERNMLKKQRMKTMCSVSAQAHFFHITIRRTTGCYREDYPSVQSNWVSSSQIQSDPVESSHIQAMPSKSYANTNNWCTHQVHAFMGRGILDYQAPACA